MVKPVVVRACAAAATAALLGPIAAGCSRAPAPPAVEISLQVVDEAALAEAVGKHRGKVVLVDYWATWCAPCVEAFPRTVDLHRRYAGRGLAVISVSMDDADDPNARAAVRAFLQEQGAAFENFASRYGVGSASFAAFDVEAVPCWKLYDRQGNLVHTLGGGGPPFDPAELDRAVETLLGGDIDF